ncbi:premnaspirodiene oxygenase-like [Olea europaea subsp. europaea]|uniref:Premnaspirodiene oxygenase-like n=1 Tax=Olea europaea subsp. europaea TaxID=158383 RepID=A0A8S0RSY1_OLEEU|nr:premnaspirodiene oxygenase-like [Olea europaea subsp. europaea]
MDLTFLFSYSTSALFISLIVLLFTKWKKSKADTKLRKLPPGPKQLPIIGHLHLVSLLPHRDFKELAKKYGPIMHLKLGETSAIVISSPEIAKEVLRNQDPTFAARSGTLSTEILWYNHTDMAFSPYNDYWRQMRKICVLELLSSKQVRSFASIRSDEVLKLVKSIKSSAGKPINLTEKIFSSTSSITARAAFGKICKDKDTLVKLFQEGVSLAAGFELADLFPSSKILRLFSSTKVKLWAMRRKLDVILDEIIDEHKENLGRMSKDNESFGQAEQTRRGNGEFGNEDLVDVFLRVKESGELSIPINYDNIKAVISDMFSAGTDTSSSTTDWAMAELMRNPRVMEKAQSEVREIFKGREIIDDTDLQKLRYLKMVIKETLRMHTAVPLLPRASTKDSEVNGYFIPANAKVFVNAWEMSRDPKYWTNPESFEPERFENNGLDYAGNDFEYLPFGSGRRMCPGMTFGIAGVELPLAQLLYNFDWKLPEGISPDSLDMTENSGITASRKEDLNVIATPYDP